MAIQTVHRHRNSSAAQLGARHSHLLHSILFGANLIQEGVYRQPYHVDDERSATYESTALALCNQADELDTIGKLLLPLDDNTAIREFLSAAHADTLQRLQRSWDVAYNHLRWPEVKLPGKAAIELHRAPKDTYDGAPDGDLGAHFADLTYWAVAALRDLHLSSRHPTRHKNNEETSLKHEIRNAKALLHAVEQTCRHLEFVGDARVARVLARYDAQTRLRTRIFAKDLPNRLQPLRR